MEAEGVTGVAELEKLAPSCVVITLECFGKAQLRKYCTQVPCTLSAESARGQLVS